MSEKIKLVFPSPGPFHVLDQEVSSRIDFKDDIDSGLNLKASRELKNLMFTVNIAKEPALYYKGNITFTPRDDLVVETSINNEKMVDLSIQHRIKETTLNLFLESYNKSISGMSTVQWDNNKTHMEVKAISQDGGMFGLSVHHALTQQLSAGFEGFFKVAQKSGGGSIGGRYRNFIFGNHTYEICSTYNVMGDLSLSNCFSIVPKFLSLATRFNINTSSMESSFELGTQILHSLNIHNHEIPLCLKLRTDSKKQNGISFDVATPIGGITLGLFGTGTKLNNYGINLNI
ncbi:hypothetical protein DLAC_10373 [Tieghemostelium lacteum]|uniref:Translocase of outer mitochondrial membrane n=1 Tax=Tieghemostelium lacteum TaxID=361077 RepID=A0A151Z585_TIELA|nr:hypothetical protein DLAC_10373 [Tieghemostelium lacteum]|eukprot:KYQ89133.1 hypothetical protein DLAC_10373 [Tieghemostelium lacteum]